MMLEFGQQNHQIIRKTSYYYQELPGNDLTFPKNQDEEIIRRVTGIQIAFGSAVPLLRVAKLDRPPATITGKRYYRHTFFLMGEF
jgi:hypothetical protein